MYDLQEKPVGNQYLEILRILVLPEILVPIAISARFERHFYVKLHNFRHPVHKKDSDIYDPVTIFNFPKTLAQNKDTFVRS